MPIPVILTTQSVLTYAQWQTWAFQPYATNTPTSWSTSPLPAGITLNPTTGLISGAATTPGVYVVAFRAINGDGSSESQVFTIGIDATSDAPPSGLVQVCIDALTKEVTFGPLGSPIAALDGGSLFTLKSGDDPVFHVVFHRAGVVLDLDLDALRFGVKEIEPDAVVVESTEWTVVGTAFRVYCQLSGTALDGALSNYETDTATVLQALGEFEWTENNPYDPAIGPETLVNTSRTFRFDIVRELLS